MAAVRQIAIDMQVELPCGHKLTISIKHLMPSEQYLATPWWAVEKLAERLVAFGAIREQQHDCLLVSPKNPNGIPKQGQ